MRIFILLILLGSGSTGVCADEISELVDSFYPPELIDDEYTDDPDPLGKLTSYIVTDLNGDGVSEIIVEVMRMHDGILKITGRIFFRRLFKRT